VKLVKVNLRSVRHSYDCWARDLDWLSFILLWGKVVADSSLLVRDDEFLWRDYWDEWMGGVNAVASPAPIPKM